MRLHLLFISHVILLWKEIKLMELNGFARAIIAPEDDNATLKSLDEFKKYGQYKLLYLFN